MLRNSCLFIIMIFDVFKGDSCYLIIINLIVDHGQVAT